MEKSSDTEDGIVGRQGPAVATSGGQRRQHSARCEYSTPFGWPVVPEVKHSAHALRSSNSGSRKTRQEKASDGHLARAAEPQAMTGGQVPSVSSEIGGAGAGTEPRPQADRPAVRIASALHQALESFARSHELGHVTGETRFDWGEIENPDLHPDLAFVSFDRWAAYRHVPTALTWHVVPDLVVEVLDESEKTEEIGPRLSDYFRAGVNRIWVVDPRDLRVFITSPRPNMRSSAGRIGCPAAGSCRGSRWPWKSSGKDTSKGRYYRPTGGPVRPICLTSRSSAFGTSSPGPGAVPRIATVPARSEDRPLKNSTYQQGETPWPNPTHGGVGRARPWPPLPSPR